MAYEIGTMYCMSACDYISQDKYLGFMTIIDRPLLGSSIDFIFVNKNDDDVLIPVAIVVRYHASR